MHWVRGMLGVMVGLIAAGVVIAAIEMAGHALWPPPAGIESLPREQLRAVLAAASPLVFVPVLVAYLLGTTLGSFLAARIATRGKWLCAGAVGLLFLLAGIANAVAIPQPLWVTVVSLTIFPPAAWLGAKLARA
ncbi:MAG TPA: hypothetical protein VL096_04075 [Pirellulaceae bacterium]|nr:hypothetical protein [Pirellulaceae bacterium]